MSSKSDIEWTEATWNPVTGCSPFSDGCKHCYALRMAKRLQAMGNKRYVNGFNVTLHHDLISLPLTWNKPRLIFVNSMSDLFHEQIPFDFIKRIFLTMERTSHHTYQVLTKRAERLAELAKMLDWPDNVWAGVTIESGKYTYRADLLRSVPAAVRFLSVEPMVGEIESINLSGIDWVITGGESGPGARPMLKDWARSMRDQCITSKVPFFFKQWGGVHKKKSGKMLDGKLWEEYPEICLS